MSDVLVLVGGDGPEDPIAWARVSRDGDILARGVARAGDAVAPAGRIVLVAPGADAQIKRLLLPARTEAQARAGAAALFEGVLAASAADTHYAVGPAQDERGARLVAAIAARRLTQWLERCAALGADPDEIVLDCCVWPTAAGEIEIVETPTRAIVAAGALGGFAIEPALAPSVFARWLGQCDETVQAIRLMGAPPQRWAAALGPGAPPLAVRPDEDALDVIARAAARGAPAAPNLRQGAFARAVRGGSPWRIWRFAAALAALALALQIGALSLAGWRDADAARAARAAAETEFRAARPDVRRIVNLQAQVAAALNGVQQAAGHPVIKVNDPVIAALQAHPAVRLDEVRHSAPGRIVRMRWSALDQTALTAAIDDLRGRVGGAVDVGAPQFIDGRLAAQVTVTAP
ncbi:MAG: type II secretion system protein GspL [Hyphomonadaceae bacterium]|nr:type II secretion system protein GspL [Hyphomonadaceae bacterium]